MSNHLVLIALLWAAVAFAVSIDASRRRRHGSFWAAVTFFTGLFGAILYVLVVLTTSDPPDDGSSRDEEPEMVRVCPDCSSKHVDSQNDCDECGAELGPEDEHPVGRRLMTGSRRYCSNCHSEVDREANACASCSAVF